MKLLFHKVLLPYIIMFATLTTFGQKGSETLSDDNVTFELKNDTLYASTGLKLFVGQELTIGKPSGIDGYFRSIISKKAAIVPSIWGQDKRYENAIENYADAKKNKERLTDFLLSSKSVTIKEISLSKTGKPFFYMVWLASNTGECKADILLALKLSELILN